MKSELTALSRAHPSVGIFLLAALAAPMFAAAQSYPTGPLRILKHPDLTSRLADDGMTVVASTPEQFAEFLTRETAKFGRVIEAAGIKGTL